VQVVTDLEQQPVEPFEQQGDIDGGHGLVLRSSSGAVD
jgi:hypothetical protein